MAEITAAMVKALREETNQGMMECKKALDESGGDMERAKDLLRKRGMVSAEKKAGRATGEGLIAIEMNPEHTSVAMVEARCETDFCARNDVFQNMVKTLGKLAFGGPDGPVAESAPIKEAVTGALAKIGENMSFARGIKISAPRVGAYLHHNGKVGVVIGVDGPVDDALLGQLCQHIAFTDPMGITPDDIPAEFVEKEKRLAVEQAVESGKPKDIAEKMVAGKIRKVLAKNALIEQPFVRDETKTVKEVLGAAKVTAFARFAVGGATA